MTLAAAALVTLLFTLPSTGQRITVDPSQGADSIMVECTGNQAIHQLSTARLYFNPETGGGWRRVQEHSAVGREGQPDSFVVDNSIGGHYYVTATNPAGESCASPEVYVPSAVVTGIFPPSTAAPALPTARLFDVQGRLVHRVVRSGIYFMRLTYPDGHVTVKRVVLLK